MSAWEVLWGQRHILLTGFQTTVELFVVCSICALLMGCVLQLALEKGKGPLTTVVRLSVDTMRMMPFLVLVYLLYYGLPVAGVRLDALFVSYVALIAYHGLYFTEILRGARSSLPRGQGESAKAHGYTTSVMYRRILLPQLIMRSAPMLGNQLIMCLKDTAFLSIITVQDLTGAATAIQSVYFIPVQAFVVAIGFYWLVSLAIEALVRKVGDLARNRGLVT
ncbi:amino acid ABC transporter permease [Pseudomonas sp. ICMP 561]|uniref:amino acid ABC transporter permease n=1 Tax=Pseudomonas sp. ICMP 561 TaxID=1718918 RepID=UPI000C08AD53|nr:ABC transporter permease subunit [Pseudomonas sp. ICMP 561]PHN17166.1 ABC transporter permease [Pseudomonas sp. ICMP 561]